MTAPGDDLRFVFDEKRAVQAVGVLLRLGGGKMNYTKLLKLLYLADRQSLINTGGTITGATFVNMAKGPVLSEVYECIQEERDDGLWDQYVRTDAFDITLLNDPGDDELSDYDVSLLERLSKKHEGDDYTDMITIVHGLPEWKHPKPAKVRPLSPAEVLRAAGVDEPSIEKHASETAYYKTVRRLLGSS